MLPSENMCTRSWVDDSCERLHVWSFVLSRRCTSLWAALFSAYQCKWDKINPRLALLLGIEAVNMRICYGEETIACFDFSQNSFGSISCSGTFALGFLRVSWVPISGIQVYSWLINRREIRDRSEHYLYTYGTFDVLSSVSNGW